VLKHPWPTRLEIEAVKALNATLCLTVTFGFSPFAMTQPVLSPAILQQISIDEKARRRWQKAALALRYPDPSNVPDWRAFVDASTAMARTCLPKHAAEALDEFFHPDGPDALLIENLPVDPELPPAPSDGRRPSAKTAVSEAVIAGLIEGHATIVSYSNEKSGAPIHEIAPATGLEEVASSSGRVRFPCHTDVAFLAPRFSPRGLLLFGLRNENSAPTSILPLDRVLDSARPGLVASLEKPIFRHPAPASFELALSRVGPVIWRDAQGARGVAVQTHAVQPVNEEARAAIAELRELLAFLQPERVIVGPAAALLFKNDRVLHGRSAFRGERWLQRAYFTGRIGEFRSRTGAAAGVFAFDARQLLNQ
jgi:hypothetical protein